MRYCSHSNLPNHVIFRISEDDRCFKLTPSISTLSKNPPLKTLHRGRMTNRGQPCWFQKYAELNDLQHYSRLHHPTKKEGRTEYTKDPLLFDDYVGAHWYWISVSKHSLALAFIIYQFSVSSVWEDKAWKTGPYILGILSGGEDRSPYGESS